jgi:hypothetical protein
MGALQHAASTRESTRFCLFTCRSASIRFIVLKRHEKTQQFTTYFKLYLQGCYSRTSPNQQIKMVAG